MDQLSLSQSVRRALIGTGALLGAMPLLAAAPGGQDNAQADEELAEVVVTGSRVRGSAPVGSAVITLDREMLESAGQSTIDRILKDIPQNFDLGVSENSRAQSGGSGNIVYGNTVNLRGVGPYATLVLLDGHRVTNNSRSTDPSILPTLGVERIEAVADGASAVYGSDAIAGVVNLIPRRSLDGVEAFVRYGTAGKEFDETVAGLAWGRVWDAGQLMLAYEHVDRSNLSGDDRGFFVGDQRPFGGRDYRTTRCNPGTLVIDTTTYAIPAGGLTQANEGELAAGTANRCNELTGQDLFPEQEYDSIASTFRRELAPWVTLIGDAYYSRRKFRRHAAYATARLNVPESNAWFVRPTGFEGDSYSIDYTFANDLPTNDTYGKAVNWQVTPGLRFTLPLGWSLEAVVGHGKTRDDADSTRGVNNAALNAALASSDPAAAFDPYGLGRTQPSVLAAISDQIFLAPTNSDFTGYELRLNGMLFTLPGGDVGLATGYERQDIEVALGSARGAPTTPVAWRHFDRQVDSAYAELQIPLFGVGNARPGFERLTLNAALRHDDYSDVGKTTNEKFGLSWKPVPQLTIRGSYGTSFRAPLISQIYGNSNNLYVQTYQNPVGDPIVGVALSGENRDLGPEKATTWSTGIDWEPLSNVSVGLTYFDINYRSQVEAYLSNLTLLAREADFDGTGIIVRGAAAGERVQELLDAGITIAAGSLPGGSAANVTLFVDGRNQNLGVSNMKGFDLSTSYRLETEDRGTFRFSLTGSYLTTFDVAITPNAAPTDRLNTIFNPLKLKLRAGVAWNRGPLGASLLVTRIHGYQNNVVTPVEGVGPYTPVDATFSMDLGQLFGSPQFEDLDFGVEIRNLRDEGPPYVNLVPGVNGSGGYDATTTNPVGRMFAVSLRKKW